MTVEALPNSFVTKTLHWVSAALVAYGYTKGLDDVSQLADPALLRSEVTFAALLGLLFAVRYAWTKRVGGQTRLPREAPRREHFASRAVHFGLYASVLGFVPSGLAIALGSSVPLLSGLFLTAMIGLHEAVLTLMPLLLIAHVAGAVWHKIVRRDGA